MTTIPRYHRGRCWICVSIGRLDQVWDIVRDFNSYPIWVNGVDESHIEDNLSGIAVGAIRNFSRGCFRTR